MKYRRRHLSRSAIRKYSAELDQRLREHCEQDRRKRFSEFRDWLQSTLWTFLLILFVAMPSLLVEVLASWIWCISHTTSKGRLEGFIWVAKGLLSDIQFYISIAILCVFVILYTVMYTLEQGRWRQTSAFSWLVVSLMGLLYSLFVVLLGLPQAVHELIQMAVFAAFVDQLLER